VHTPTVQKYRKKTKGQKGEEEGEAT